MNIRVIYDPILRSTVAPVTVFDGALKKEAEEMLALMKKSSGLGLAANQVGLNKQLIVLGYHQTSPDDDVPEIPFQVLCNPKVIKLSTAKDIQHEGCLSLPGLELPVERSLGVVVAAQNISGQQVIVKAKGLHARVLQHEIDHLNGILFTDHVKNYKKIDDYQWARIVFCGSDDFSAPVLQALLDAKLNVMCAITESSKRAGRGATIADPIIKTIATEAGIAVFQPESKEEITAIMTQLKPDLLVLASYGKILPADALMAPIYGCLNVHPSLLPKYRGATPIQSAILNGDSETGVTIMEMVPAVDAGAILAQEKISLNQTETYVHLKEKLAQTGAKLLLKTIPTFLAGQAQAENQTAEATMTRKLTKEMGEINWDNSVEAIDRQIRALNPWPGTYTWLDGKRLKILAANINGEKLALETVQLEGKNTAPWADFARGYANQLTKASWFSKIS